jgi:23S rRNA A1618 N6-methylase RlmF
MNDFDYWEECIAITAEECELPLTKEQLEYLAEAVSGAHENYGMAFYSPPDSDRISDIERGWKKKLDDLQKEFDAYRNGSEKAIKNALKTHWDAHVTIDNEGSVYQHGGRTERIL